ncbi:OmpH family outer membrane protein [Bizionia sediminis]|uniref:OmpH family outer membrane protein n=1 Tax=Bizionia sediminis TaxID=1737064 RepID=A0ABW5KUU7_9FLAO
MKLKVLFLVAAVFMLSLSSFSQRGVRIGYIDTEYILENVPEYQQATAQLETKVQKWKNEIEEQLGVIAQKRKDLSNEKALLTKELIEEREEDIFYEEKEILDYQQKRFGPNGDLMLQKKQLIQPIQDQIFAAVQDIAEQKKYDFVFDKSADIVMLYSAKRYDFSEQVIRSLTRSAKRTQAASKAEKRAAEEEDLVIDVDEEQEARNAEADERRQEIINEREARKLAAQKRRDSIIEVRRLAREEALRNRNQNTQDTEQSEVTNDTDAPTNSDASNTNTSGKNEDTNATEASASEEKTPAQLAEERRQQKIADRERRKAELEARKQRILAEREQARKEREAARNNTTPETPANEDDNN